VADQQDRVALRLQRAHKIQHLRGFLDAQRRRRLVHDDDLGVPAERARDRDRLPLAADFVFFHECAHLRRQTRDEIEANCHALLEARAIGLVDAAAEKELETFHQRLGRLPLRYGGNGTRFWASTLACVEDPEAHAEDPQAFPGGMFDPPFAP
jgi:hypothetical protein